MLPGILVFSLASLIAYLSRKKKPFLYTFTIYILLLPLFVLPILGMILGGVFFDCNIDGFVKHTTCEVGGSTTGLIVDFLFVGMIFSNISTLPILAVIWTGYGLYKLVTIVIWPRYLRFKSKNP